MAERPKVLLVEDDRDTRHMYAMWLEAIGFDVHEAGDGVEGVRSTQNWHPDVVLMDLAMPRMDGFEATRTIKQNPATSSVPVVILSAFSSARDRQRALEAGAAEFLGKPCDLDLVASRVRHYSRAC